MPRIVWPLLKHSKAVKVLQSRNEAGIDLVALVGRYVDLQQRGRDWVGLCPFHAERTPSFNVSTGKQLFYCFGCGMGGDAVRFLQEMEGLSATAARARLHEAERPAQASQPPRENPRPGYYRLLHEAAQLYHRCLLRAPFAAPARDYLTVRGITAETIATFMLGFVPPRGTALLVPFAQRRDWPRADLQTLGLLTTTGQERFAGRVSFPIHDAQGRVVGLGGRSLPGQEEPKYLNSAASPVFQKGQHLFNWHRARTAIQQEGRVLLLEGYMDVLALWQAGLRHSVGVLGTSLGEAQARRMRQLQVTLVYDADSAGEQAALRSATQLERAGSWVRIATLPRGLDPDGLLRQPEGFPALQTALQEAGDRFAFQLQLLRRTCDYTQPTERAQYVQQAVELLVSAPPVVQAEHLQAIAQACSLPLSVLEDELAYARRRLRRSGATRSPRQEPAWHEPAQHKEGTLPTSPPATAPYRGLWQARTMAAERWLLAMMMQSKALTHWVQTHVGDGFPTDHYGALAAHLYAYYADPGKGQEERAAFLAQLTDPLLKAEATQLARQQIPCTVAGLRDCLLRLRAHPLLKLTEQGEAALQRLASRASAQGEEQALQMLIRTVELRRQAAKQLLPSFTTGPRAGSFKGGEGS